MLKKSVKDKKELKDSKNKEINESKGFAFLGVLLTIIGFVLVLILRSKDRYARFYAKQGLVLFIGMVIAAGVSIVPFVGKFISSLFWVVMIILWIIALINSLSGKRKETPIIGYYARNIDF